MEDTSSQPSMEQNSEELGDSDEDTKCDINGKEDTGSPSGRVNTKVCGVCGDNALGYNFNAVTCESCKAFFRRNALKKKEFRCPFNGECRVDTVTRRFCQRCRLMKCFTIGMKKEWILSEEEKQLKKQKIQQNRAKRLTRSTVSSSSTSLAPQMPSDVPIKPQARVAAMPQAKRMRTESSESKVACQTPVNEIHLPLSSPSETCGNTTGILPNLMSPEASNSASPSPSNYMLSHSMSPVTETEGATLSDSNSSSNPAPQSSFATMETILSVAIKAEFSSRNVHGHSAGELNEAEKLKLQELIIANRALLAPVDEDGQVKMGITDPSLINVINLTDIAIRRLIKMAKRINGFKMLCQADQIALLKGSCTELMILRSVMTYDPDKDVWKVPHSHDPFCSIKVDVLKEAQGNLYEEHRRFTQSFRSEWRNDENIMVILGAITLFTPERPNIVHKEVIQLEQESYYYLLKRYLGSIFSGCEARATYLQLIHRIAELHGLNDNHVRAILGVKPRDVEPLLIEIFDLK